MSNFIPASSLTIIDSEPRILDVDLAERLALSHLPEIRRLIERNRDELEMHGQVCVTATQTSAKGGRPGKAYYLNEGQALVICSMSRTAKAAQIRKLIIDVFMDWRQGKLVHVKEHNRRYPAPRVAPTYAFKLQHYSQGGYAKVEALVPFDMALAYFEAYRQLSATN